MGTTYNIIRAEKVKSKSAIEKICRHNFRIGKQPNNVNPQKSHLNKILFNSLSACTSKVDGFCNALDEFYERKNITIKQTKDKKQQPVLLTEWVASASHDFFKGMTVAQVEEWANHYMDYLKSEFGDCVKMAILHLDEHTPHLHVLISPEETKLVTRKNRYGSKQVEMTTLNAKRWDPEFMEQVQSRSHEWMQKYYPNLTRGVPGSNREHVHQKEFYAQQAKAMSTTSNFDEVTQKAIDGLNVVKLPFAGEYVKLDEVKKIIEEKLAPAYNRVKFIETMEKFSPNALTYKTIKDRKKKLDKKEDDLEVRESTLVKAQHNVLNIVNDHKEEDAKKDELIASLKEQVSIYKKAAEYWQSVCEKYIPGYKAKKQNNNKI